MVGLHKRKRSSWSLSEKRDALEFLKTHTMNETIAKFGCTRSTLNGWVNNTTQLEAETQIAGSAKRRRLNGGGRKVTDNRIEQSTLSFVVESRDRGLALSGSLVQGEHCREWVFCERSL